MNHHNFTFWKGIAPQTLKDSLKTGQNAQVSSYNFQVKVKSNHPELIEIGTSYDVTQGEVVSLSTIENTAKGANENIYQLEYVPVGIGKKELTIYAVDHFGSRSNIYLDLMVYENLKPVAVMQYKHIGSIRPGHFEINAYGSYDQDEKYGGKITKYLFEINGKVIQTEKPMIEYIFQEPGQHELILKVRDNDETWSETLRAMVPINF